MAPFFLKRMLRSPGKHLCVLLVTLALSGLLCFLAGFREKQETSREAVIDSAEVLCVVTDIKGTQSEHLQMGYGAAQAVTLAGFYRLPEYVKDIRMTKELTAVIPGVGTELTITAVTGPEGIEKLDPALGAEVTLLREDFYGSDEPLLIVSEQVFEALGGETTLKAYLQDPKINPELFPNEPGKGRGEEEFTVAGCYKGVGSELYMPFGAAMLIIDRISGSRSLDSLSFLAKDNRRIDELREAAGEVFGTVDPQGNYGEHRFALTVHDEELERKVAAFDQNLRRMDILIPAGLALTLAAGLLMGFISTRSEKDTYALARSVGMTKKRLLRSALAEQLLLPLAACILTGAAFLKPLPALAVLGLYALGCFAAVLRAVSVPPTELLREQE